MSLTDWETGQEFIAISDFIDEKMAEINHSKFPNLLKEMDKAKACLGDELDALKSHAFGIYNGVNFEKEYKEKI